MGSEFKRKQVIVANVVMDQMFELSFRDFKVTMMKDLDENVDKCEQIRNSNMERGTAKTKIKWNY